MVDYSTDWQQYRWGRAESRERGRLAGGLLVRSWQALEEATRTVIPSRADSVEAEGVGDVVESGGDGGGAYVCGWV